MKHAGIFLLLCLLIGLQTVHSQTASTTFKEVHTGVHGSPIVYLPSWHLSKGSQKPEPQMGYMTGISFQYNFSKRLALYTELNYEQINYKTVAAISDDIIYQDVFIENQFMLPTDHSYKKQYISMPLSLKFNMIKREKFSFFLNTGTYLNNFFSENVTTTNHYTGEILHNNHFDRKERYIGAIAGLGIDCNFTKKLHLLVEARDYVINRYMHETDPDFELTSHSFRFLMGLTYRIY